VKHAVSVAQTNLNTASETIIKATKKKSWTKHECICNAKAPITRGF
jgi:hypothetical protein